MKRYALKGINDEATECSVCGKVELKRVMWLVALDSDGNATSEAFHCGTTCGAKLLGYTQGKISTKVKNFASEVLRKREQLYYSHPSYALSREKLIELNRINEQTIRETGKSMGWQSRKNHPIYAQFVALDKEAKEWAETQEIMIDL